MGFRLTHPFDNVSSWPSSESDHKCGVVRDPLTFDVNRWADYEHRLAVGEAHRSAWPLPYCVVLQAPHTPAVPSLPAHRALLRGCSRLPSCRVTAHSPHASVGFLFAQEREARAFLSGEACFDRTVWNYFSNTQCVRSLCPWVKLVLSESLPSEAISRLWEGNSEVASCPIHQAAFRQDSRMGVVAVGLEVTERSRRARPASGTANATAFRGKRQGAKRGLGSTQMELLGTLTCALVRSRGVCGRWGAEEPRLRASQ